MVLHGIVACVLAQQGSPGAIPAAPVATVPPPAAAAAAPAPAASPSAAPPVPLGVGESPTVTVDVGAWVPRLTGTAKVGAAGTKLELNHDLAVDDSVAAPAGEIGVWFDRWRVGVVGFESTASSTERARVGGTFGNTSFAAGDTIHGSYSAWMVGAEAGYVVFRPFSDRPWAWDEPGANRAQATEVIGANGRPRFDLQVLVLGGGLAFDYEETLANRSGGGSSEFSKLIGCVYGGVGLDMRMGFDGRVPLVQDVRLYANLGIGPSIPDADIVWMIRVGVDLMLTGNVGIELGYRLFDFNLQDGPSEVDGGLRGLFGGVTVRF